MESIQLSLELFKRCSKCKLELDIGKFDGSVRSKDGLYAWCKPCRKIARVANREVARVQERKWLARNREKRVEQNKAWRVANPERYAFLIRRASEIRDTAAYQRKPERKEWARLWRERNKVKWAGYSRKRREGLIPVHTQKQWDDLCSLYGGRCVRCLEVKFLTRDHVIPVSKGGTDDIENIQPLCKSCNSWKHDREIDFRPQWGCDNGTVICPCEAIVSK